ncbi:hypothetical protein [Methylobacterium sp. E-046]|jgi:hypothetical protein|uniref:hypothetical protein n=1 Tax=Methylobacterium sp. E-046 TaxID=2836576 RepID=UPI001FBBFCAF|nr:hypothetical protein [Methylobacterium sp. E-046]MCJ2102318.1 hypothetical protein [Methylobacterium sp. E-046]
MSQNLKIKRGLLRLGRATVRELAAFADANESTVRNYLTERRDLCTREEVAPAGRGRPSLTWTLTPSGRAVLREELRAEMLASDDPAIDEERATALEHVKTSLRDLDEHLAGLEAGDVSEDRDAAFAYLRARTKALSRAVGRLAGSGPSLVAEEIALRGIDGRLDALDERRQAVEAVTEVVRESISDGMSAWVRRLAGDIGRTVRGAVGTGDVFVPDGVTDLGPVLIIDASGPFVGSDPLLDAARRANAPAMCLHVPMLAEAEMASLLTQVASSCAELAGSWTRLVYRYDSRHPESRSLLDSFGTVDDARWQASYPIEPSRIPGPHPGDVHVRHAKRMLGVAGRFASGLDPAPRRLPGQSGSPVFEASSPRIVALWCDAAEPSVVRKGSRSGAGWMFEGAPMTPDEAMVAVRVSPADLLGTMAATSPPHAGPTALAAQGRPTREAAVTASGIASAD